jgi:hypothetical protein
MSTRRWASAGWAGDNKIIRATMLINLVLLSSLKEQYWKEAFCDNPAAVIMALLEALDEKTQARMMPIYSKNNREAFRFANN